MVGQSYAIEVDDLLREFAVTVREPGLSGALQSVLHRKQRTITAVDRASFRVESGTILGLLGPNGSGKTTTLKCVAGLLTPTAGRVRVLGHTPSQRDPDFLRQLGFVMGQRWQLHVDLPVWESFELHRIVYDLDRAPFERTRDELMGLLDLDEIVHQPARKLSLGQRMRCEFVASLLHRPRVVLLDEPTLGLDFDAQAVIRRFVTSYVESTGAAVVLTSHYLADIEALCQRVIAISRGRLTFDGTLAELKGMAGGRKRVTARLLAPMDATSLRDLGDVIECGADTVVVEVERGLAGATVGALERFDNVADVSLTDPPLEDTLRDLYRTVA